MGWYGGTRGKPHRKRRVNECAWVVHLGEFRRNMLPADAPAVFRVEWGRRQTPRFVPTNAVPTWLVEKGHPYGWMLVQLDPQPCQSTVRGGSSAAASAIGGVACCMPGLSVIRCSAVRASGSPTPAPNPGTTLRGQGDTPGCSGAWSQRRRRRVKTLKMSCGGRDTGVERTDSTPPPYRSRIMT